MANHLELIQELQQLDKVPSLERLRAAQKRRTQQLKRWAVYEKEMQNKKRKADKKGRIANSLQQSEPKKHVSFAASVALLEASARNDPDEVRYLLRNNVSPDLCNEDGLTALHQVRLSVSTCPSLCPSLTFLIGADLLAVNSDGNMPYDLCEDDPTLDIIETAMANRGITQEMINETRASTERKMIGDIQELLSQGEKVNQQDSQGATLLHIAAANGYAQAAELLLEGGARVDLRDSDGWQPLHAAACWGQMHVAELLVSHGASLNAKTFLEETPIDLCEDEEFRAILLDLKHKHDIIMKSQLKHKTSLCRRTSSAGSRGKVVRRASLSDRHNLCRKEYETEAIVWRKEKEDEDEKEKESDQENSQPVVAVELPDKSNLPTILKEGKQNGLISTTTSMPPQPPSNGSTPTSSKGGVVTTQPSQEEAWPKERPQTLSELKKQRAAAKLLNHPLFNGHLGNGSTDSFTDAKTTSEDPRMPLVSSNGNAVYYTPASGDPPLLKFKQPMEEEQPKVRTCCCVS
uniref:Protein phosphatase 1, regulatory subunit 16B n=1 Tax=Haplochromis burtoni TaxID=8153 RepID=A0A3Q2WKW6_HAPBU